MQGYDSTSYGTGFADVYDEWYADVTNVDATVRRMLDLAGPAGSIVELGVGTGRIAVPLAAVYPKDGTLVSDNPWLVLDASWVSDEHRAAALLAGEPLRVVDEERDDRQRVDDGQQGDEGLEIHGRDCGGQRRIRGPTGA